MEEPVRRLLGVDTEFVRWMPPSCWTREGHDTLFIDAWGVPWRCRAGASYYELDASPFASLDYAEILQRPWKPLLDAAATAGLKEQADYMQAHHDSALLSDQIGAGLFERAWYLRGFEQFLMDMVLDKPMVHRFMGRLLEHQMEGYAAVFDAVGTQITGVLLTDDLATQDSLIISRELYREMVFPYQKRLLDFIRSRKMKTVFHSCGAVCPLIPDLLEAGVEILHPIQRTARGMDPLHIKREFGSDLVLWGAGCDTGLLQNGTMAMVVEDTRRMIGMLAPGGGYVFTTTHCIQPGTPPGNILAMAGVLRGEECSPGHEIDWVRHALHGGGDA